MATVYKVWDLDVWGHSPGECAEHGCPCVKDDEHDDDACACCHEINDRFDTGTLDVPDPVESSTDPVTFDNAIVESLIAQGFLNGSARGAVEIDDPSCDGESIYVLDSETSEPLLQLERTRAS